MLKPWNMDWTSCLVRTHPEGEQGLDHMRLGHRIEVINYTSTLVKPAVSKPMNSNQHR